MDNIELTFVPHPNGEIACYDANRFDGAPDAGHQAYGHGRTEAEAFLDFAEQFAEIYLDV